MLLPLLRLLLLGALDQHLQPAAPGKLPGPEAPGQICQQRPEAVDLVTASLDHKSVPPPHPSWMQTASPSSHTKQCYHRHRPPPQRQDRRPPITAQRRTRLARAGTRHSKNAAERRTGQRALPRRVKVQPSATMLPRGRVNAKRHGAHPLSMQPCEQPKETKREAQAKTNRYSWGMQWWLLPSHQLC